MSGDRADWRGLLTSSVAVRSVLAKRQLHLVHGREKVPHGFSRSLAVVRMLLVRIRKTLDARRVGSALLGGRIDFFGDSGKLPTLCFGLLAQLVRACDS